MNGEWTGKSGDPQQTHSHLNYFLMLFPPSQLNHIVIFMNGELGRIERHAQQPVRLLNSLA